MVKSPPGPHLWMSLDGSLKPQKDLICFQLIHFTDFVFYLVTVWLLEALPLSSITLFQTIEERK